MTLLERLSKLPEDEARFIIIYGWINCFRRKFFSYRKIMHLIHAKYESQYDITSNLRDTIRKFSGKEVLVYRCRCGHGEDDYFICGDDDIPFSNDMFKPEIKEPF